MAIISAFQANDAGSISADRSSFAFRSAMKGLPEVTGGRIRMGAELCMLSLNVNMPGGRAAPSRMRKD